jgi:hypothetical protein
MGSPSFDVSVRSRQLLVKVTGWPFGLHITTSPPITL